MRTSDEIYHQVRWDPRFDPARFVMGVSRRGAEPKRIPLPAFVPGGDIPWHRVLFVEADGEVVWDRATGVDRVDATGAGRVQDPRRLRAPFFSARAPHPGSALSPTTSTSLRVLTWNTLWDRFDGDLVDTERRRPLLIDALKRADADVIALQEVQDELLALLLAAPWIRDGYGLGTDPRRNDVDECGLLLLSRLPIREAGHHVLGPHKAVAAIVVETGAGPLTIAVTHLTSDHSDNGAARRVEQLGRIAGGLATVEGDLILVGDFNDGSDVPESALGMRDAWLEAHGPDDATPTFDPHANPLAAINSLSGRASRLDRILVRSQGMRTARVSLIGDTAGPDGLFASDHFGVAADLDLEPTGGIESVLDVAATARTALAWLPPEELRSALDEIRRDHDPQIHRWPPHVNVLFGFVPESDFDAAAPLIAEALRGIAAFPARLRGVHTFGHRDDATVWLDPAADGVRPWTDLRAALEKRFPRCRGRVEGFTPHLTLGRSKNAQRVAAECRARLDEMSVEVGELALLSRRGDEPMRVRAVVSLGTGVVRWLDAEPVVVSAADPPFEPVVEKIAEALPDGAVHLVGSRRMGCALPGADLDLVVALSGRADLSAVRARVAAAVPGAVGIREVIGARVPGIRFSVDSSGPSASDLRRGPRGDLDIRLDVDVVVVATGGIPPGEAVERRAELGEPAAIALSAVSDANAVAAAGAETSQLTRRVKAWAKARGLDSAPFGGLPGVAWATLAALTVARSQDLGPRELLRAFFADWAARDWSEPVGLTSGPGDSSAAMTILTPTAPVRTCTAQVSQGGLDLVVEELYRAWELLESGVDARLLAPPPMHRRHAAWAVVAVPSDPDILGRTRGRLRALLTALEDAGAVDAHAWPRPFASAPDSGSTPGSGPGSGSSPTRFAIGLGRTPPDATAVAAAARRWSENLPGVTVELVGNGEVPTLR